MGLPRLIDLLMPACLGMSGSRRNLIAGIVKINDEVATLADADRPIYPTDRVTVGKHMEIQ